MKKYLLFLLLFVISTIGMFAQTGEEFERYVGSEHGKYPLTVNGLKNAIASLDSGIVHMAYPGIWDTTGLGAIPSTVELKGRIGGKEIGAIPYWIYRALFTQIGTNDPTVTVLESTMGTITWTRDGPGFYIGELEEAYYYEADKIMFSNGVSDYYGNFNILTPIGGFPGDPPVRGYLSFFADESNAIYIECFDTSGVMTDWDALGGGGNNESIFPIEVRIYYD